MKSTSQTPAQATEAVETAEPADGAQPKEAQAAHGRHKPKAMSWLKYSTSAALVAAGLMASKLAVETTPLGVRAEKAAQELLSVAFERLRPSELGVTLLDIGHLAAGTEDVRTGKITPTPRAELLKLIKELAKLRPKAIGIDIDFSPASGWWVEDDDPDFFQQCLDISTSTVPIVLGVYRGMRGNRDGWLGAYEYASLAGGMWLHDQGLERGPIWTKVPQAEDRLPSMGFALAAASRPESVAALEEGGIVRRTRERVVEEAGHLQVGEVLTDYSIASKAMDRAIRITSADQLFRVRAQIRGKVVILGQVERALDHFVVPGHPRAIPGVVVHAAVFNSLAHEPVYEFSHGARIFLDIVVSTLFLAAVPLMSGRSRHRLQPGQVARSERRVRAWLILGVLAAGSLFVVLARVLWLDFLLVALCLLVHPMAGELAHRIAHRLRRRRTGWGSPTVIGE